MKTTTLLFVYLITIGFIFGNALADKDCSNDNADLVFVLDESGSIWGPDFVKQLVFVNNVIKVLDVGPDKFKVGVLVFGDNNRIIVQLGNYTDVEDLKGKVSGIKQKRGNTHTDKALKELREVMFSTQNSRPNVPHVAIVITDGDSDDFNKTRDEAKLCRDAKIQIYAIGVGQNISTEELENIAGNPDHVFSIDEYDALESLLPKIDWMECNTSSTTTPPTNPTITNSWEPSIQVCEGLLDIIVSISALAGVEGTQEVIDFIQYMTLGVTVDRQHVQIGLAPTFCDEGEEIKIMGEEIWAALENRTRPGLRTDLTLDYIRKQGYNSSNGGRAEAVKFAILIVDDKFKDQKATLEEAHQARADGIHLVVIGVGDRVNEFDLRQLVHPKQDYFHVKNYTRLYKIWREIRQTLCEGMTDKKQDDKNVTQGQQNARQVKQNAKQGQQNAKQGQQNAKQGQQNARQVKQNAKQGQQNAKQGQQNARQVKQNAKQDPKKVEQGQQNARQVKQNAKQDQKKVEQGQQNARQVKQNAKQDPKKAEQGQQNARQVKQNAKQDPKKVKQDQKNTKQGQQNGKQ